MVWNNAFGFPLLKSGSELNIEMAAAVMSSSDASKPRMGQESVESQGGKEVVKVLGLKSIGDLEPITFS